MKIETDGYYKVHGSQSGSSIVMISGTFTTATLGYYDDYLNFIPLTDGGLLAGEQYVLDHGMQGAPIYVHMVGATAASLMVNGKP